MQLSISFSSSMIVFYLSNLLSVHNIRCVHNAEQHHQNCLAFKFAPHSNNSLIKWCLSSLLLFRGIRQAIINGVKTDTEMLTSTPHVIIIRVRLNLCFSSARRFCLLFLRTLLNLIIFWIVVCAMWKPNMIRKSVCQHHMLKKLI